MILWCDGAHDAGENMRRDTALLRSRTERPDLEPVLRLFRFEPPGITLGHSQNAARELDLARCRRDGVTWAIRPTGGRAIFHADEWTYSFCAAIADPKWGGTLTQAYDRLAALLLASLEHLGVSAARALPRGPRAERAERTGAGAASSTSAPCFATTTRHEIVRDGRKLVGSAQRRTATALLQQGSVLLSEQHLRLADYLAIPEAEREPLRTQLRAASTHIGDVVGGRAPLSRWAEAIAAVMPARQRVDGADAFPLTA